MVVVVFYVEQLLFKSLYKAVVRYNVAPVEGLFFSTSKFKYHLQIRFRGQITARLMQVDIQSGAETQLILFDSNSFPPKPGFQVQAVSAPTDSAFLDFVEFVRLVWIASAGGICLGEVGAAKSDAPRMVRLKSAESEARYIAMPRCRQ